MLKAVNIGRCFRMFSDTFSPKIVGELNGQHVKLLLFEPEHTGNVRAEITKDEYGRLEGTGW